MQGRWKREGRIRRRGWKWGREVEKEGRHAEVSWGRGESGRMEEEREGGVTKKSGRDGGTRRGEKERERRDVDRERVRGKRESRMHRGRGRMLL